jgi:hypothetical protein
MPDYTVLQPRRQPSSYSPPWEPQILLSPDRCPTPLVITLFFWLHWTELIELKITVIYQLLFTSFRYCLYLNHTISYTLLSRTWYCGSFSATSRTKTLQLNSCPTCFLFLCGTDGDAETGRGTRYFWLFLLQPTRDLKIQGACVHGWPCRRGPWWRNNTRSARPPG